MGFGMAVSRGEGMMEVEIVKKITVEMLKMMKVWNNPKASKNICGRYRKRDNGIKSCW